MSDMDVGDCSTDGTCEDVTGPGGAMIPIEGVKFSNATLLEETTLAIQQFSIGNYDLINWVLIYGFDRTLGFLFSFQWLA